MYDTVCMYFEVLYFILYSSSVHVVRTHAYQTTFDLLVLCLLIERRIFMDGSGSESSRAPTIIKGGR